MAAVMTRDNPHGRGTPGSSSILGQYQRFLLMLLIALALFGAVSLAAPREAEAAGTGYYWTNHGGQNYRCFWIYHGTDAYGNAVWTEDGCEFYYNAQLPTYYQKYSTNPNQTLVKFNGYWWDVASFWRNSSFSQMVVSRPNTAGYALLDAQVNQTLSVGLASTRSATKAFTDSETLRVQEAYSDAGTVRAPEAGQPSEASTDSKVLPDAETTKDTSTKANFPWKVCQDDSSGCMKYGEDAWKKVSASKAQGGTYRVSSSKIRGAFFAAAGNTDAAGSTMQLTTATGPKMGKAKVLVVNLAKAKVVKKITFDLRSSKQHYKVAKNISGLTPHIAYGLVVLSADGRPVAVDSVGYEAHGDMCHNVL